MKHSDGLLHVRGASEFVDDAAPPEGMLHAAVHASPVAHGRILNVDVSAAASVKGVAAVMSADDIPGENEIGPIISDECLLAEDVVRYVGQPVALIVAETAGIARKASALVQLDTEGLPPILDPRAAYEAGQIIGDRRTVQCGNVEEAWRECDFVVEGRCVSGGQEHAYLETQRSRAVPLEGGRFRVFASTQSPASVQKAVARVLSLPVHDVEVEVLRLGGGFGGKEDQATPWACLAALGAWKTGSPVEIVLRRGEDIRMTGKRHPYDSDFKIGARSDGRILAFEVRYLQNAGAAADLSPAVLGRTLLHSTGAYSIPNVRATGYSCRTNLPPNTAFRGFGGPQAMFVMESAVTLLAEQMGMDRADLQQKNLIASGDVFPYGQKVADSRARKTWSEASTVYDLARMRSEVVRHNESDRRVKKGLAVMPVAFGISFTKTFLNQAGALLHVYTDGSVSVSTGGVEMGQGLRSNITRVVSRAFGIRSERVRIESTNTGRVANMSASAASSTTMLNGNAALAAVAQIRGDLVEVIVRELELPDTTVVTIVDERVLCDGVDSGVCWEDLVRRAYASRVSLSAHGFYATPGIHYDGSNEQGHPFAYHSYGTAIVQVAVDSILGTYEIEAVRIVQDLGRTINPAVDLGQIEGGVVQGIGWLTTEEVIYDAEGRLLTDNLSRYKIPDVYSIPDQFEVRFLEAMDQQPGPFGSKAVGEPPLMFGIAAYFALRDAIRAVRSDQGKVIVAPMTPERVLLSLYPEAARELDRAESGEAGQPTLV